MYEKPQYLTPKGYKRMDKDPKKKEILKKIMGEKKGKEIYEIKPLLKKNTAKPKKLSKEAAKAIAMAIKGMLNEQ